MRQSLELEDLQCTVCYEITTDILPCLHSLCHECFDLWILSHNTCPICRSFISQKQKEKLQQIPNSRISAMNESNLRTSHRNEPFSVVVASQISTHTYPQIDGFNFFMRFRLRNPSQYRCQRTRYGYKVIYSPTNRWFQCETLKIGDIITHIDYQNLLTHPELLNQTGIVLCHILERNFFASIMTPSSVFYV